MIPFNHLGFIFKNFGSLIYPKVIVQELCVFLKSCPVDASVLDLGAGTGMMSQFAYKCNPELQLVAVDPAEGMMRYTPKYLELHIASAEKLPFEDASFDALMMGESLHHFDNPEIALKEVVRVLKKDGKLFIYDFDKSSFLGNSICKVEKFLGEPAHFYEPNDLKNTLETLGFSVKVSSHKWRYTIEASKTET